MFARAVVPGTSDVLQNWDKYTVRQDGDAIRRLIGTIGVSSPLSSVRRAFVSIRDAEEESVRMLARRRLRCCCICRWLAMENQANYRM